MRFDTDCSSLAERHHQMCPTGGAVGVTAGVETRAAPGHSTV